MIKRIVFLCLVVGVALFSSSAAYSQTWSSEQTEVWDVIKAQWKASSAKESWVDQFLADDFQGWNRDTPAPRDKMSQAKWDRYSNENSTSLVNELSPLRIVVHGSTAVAHYYYSTAAEDREGKRETTHGRYTDILVKDGGSWRFIAWQGGDDPGGDD